MGKTLYIAPVATSDIEAEKITEDFGLEVAAHLGPEGYPLM